MPDHRATELTDVTAILLAGGQGTRLHELTETEAKPAIPFGPNARIVDFTMANAARAGARRLLAATQHRPETLKRHLRARWGALWGERLMIRDGAHAHGGYGGTAGAVAANRTAIDAGAPRFVAVLAGDHVCAIDLRAMAAAHVRSGRPATVAVTLAPLEAARGFGVLTVGGDDAITAFTEKPARPAPAPGRTHEALVSMGVYIFDWLWLRALLAREAAQPGAPLDFGRDVVPAAVAEGAATAWLHADAGRSGYWRDVGTLDAYRLALLDFGRPVPPCPSPFAAPPRGPRRAGGAPAGRLPLMIDSVAMPGAGVSPGARVTRAILAPGAIVPPGLVIGEDPEEDTRWFRVTTGGTRLVTPAMLARREAQRPRFFRVAATAEALQC